MNKLIPILTSVLLIACGGGDSTPTTTIPTVNCITSSSNNTNTPVDNNSIKVSISKLTNNANLRLRSVPADNIIVQLNNSGPCQRTNKDGIALFTARNIEPHDLHVFAPTGYRWVSKYGAVPGNVTEFNIGFDSTTDTEPFSFITLNGSVTGLNPSSRLEFTVIAADGDYHKYQAKILPNGAYTVNLQFEVAPESVITPDIIVLENQIDTTTGVKTVVDTTVISGYKITTTATSTRTQNLPLIFSTPKPTPSKLLSFSSISLPPGFQLEQIHIGSYPYLNPITVLNPPVTLFNQVFTDITPQRDLSVATSFTAFDQFKLTKHRFSLLSIQFNANNAIRWRHVKVYPESLIPQSITPQITAFPNFNSKQSGDILSWNNVDQNLTSQTIRLFSKGNSVTWILEIEPTATSVTLPTIPAGITTRLVKDQALELKGSIYTPATEQFEGYTIFGTTLSP